MENLELMEKWHSMAVLHGINVEELEDQWYNDDEKDLLQLLLDIETMNRRIANPTAEMRFALLSSEMGVTCDAIREYDEYRYRVEFEEQQRLTLLAEANNPHIKQLVEGHNFRFVTGKQYPKHTHFEFTSAKGIDVKGRIFRSNWAYYRVCLTWKNAKNKVVRQLWTTHTSSVKIPKDFPNGWATDSYTVDPKRMSYTIAHMVNHNTLPKAGKHLMPKR